MSQFNVNLSCSSLEQWCVGGLTSGGEGSCKLPQGDTLELVGSAESSPSAPAPPGGGSRIQGSPLLALARLGRLKADQALGLLSPCGEVGAMRRPRTGP